MRKRGESEPEWADTLRPQDLALMTKLVMRGYEFLRESGMGASVVSQRDLQRVFNLFLFFRSILLRVPRREAAATPSYDDVVRRALMASIGLTFYARLLPNAGPGSRQAFAKMMESEAGPFGTSFLVAYNQMIDLFISNTHIPEGIAKNEALKENVFSMVVAIATKIPLLVWGGVLMSAIISPSA